MPSSASCAAGIPRSISARRQDCLRARTDDRIRRRPVYHPGSVRILSNTGLLSVRQGSGTIVQSQGYYRTLQQRLRRAAAPDLDEVRQLLELKIAEKAALTVQKKI